MVKKCIVVLLLLFSCVSFVYAHPGRTDGEGGHYETATGEYHYHHGYPAHSHFYGCPYNYDDQTGSSSGKPSKGKNDKASSKEILATVAGCVFSVLICFVLPDYLLSGKKQTNQSKKTPVVIAPTEPEVAKISDSTQSKNIIAKTLRTTNVIRRTAKVNCVSHIVCSTPIPFDSPFYIKTEFRASARLYFGYAEWKHYAESFIPF
jgi:hypothetical protein